MGDYVKLIIDAEVRVSREALEHKLDELPLCVSAYHSEGFVKEIQAPEYGDKDRFMLVVVGQTKYGRGQEEFLNWLKPFVTQGSGPSEIWAFQINEYTSKPTVWEMHPETTDGI